MNRFVHYALFALVVTTLYSCESNTIKSDTAGKHNPAKQQLPTITPKDLLTLAQQKNSPERENLILRAAELYGEQLKFDKTHSTLNMLDATKLNDDNFIYYCKILGSTQLKENSFEFARRTLTNTRIEKLLKSLDPQPEINLREIRAQMFERNGLLEESVAERISIATMLTNAQAVNTNQDLLWQTILNIPLTKLQTYALKGSSGITQGWYSLAALSKNNTLDVDSQQALLNKWLTQWRNHPAANNLPKDLLLLQTLTKQQPKKIALLLPMQGRLAEAGEAARDGFFAAYYLSLNNQLSVSNAQSINNQQTPNHQVPSVRQYDTSKGAVAAYQQAVAEGADLIIGPLDKEDVNQLSHLPLLTVPLLTLNYPDQQPAQPLANFYQFGLAVEDEARQVARRGIQDGHKRAFVISIPQDWSERSAQAFINEWQNLGGIIVGKNSFVSLDKFSESFSNLMLIDESHARKNELQQQLNVKLEFTARRRNDVDMIFMAATHDQGRQIKPMLVFHFANNIPTYATSIIYSGEPNSDKNEDLNGLLFNTLPWIFDTESPEKKAIAQNTKSSAVYGRLHALGADAFHLYARLPQLKQAPDMRIYGATGSLHLLADGRIEHEQLWAQFKNGLAEPLVTIVDTDETDSSE